MEQRLANLEEEVKLLKNQIRSVLLDIKENLSSNDWQTGPGQKKEVDTLGEAYQPPTEENRINKSDDNSKPLTGKMPIPAELKNDEGTGKSANQRPLPHPSYPNLIFDRQASPSLSLT